MNVSSMVSDPLQVASVIISSFSSPVSSLCFRPNQGCYPHPLGPSSRLQPTKLILKELWGEDSPRTI